MTRNHIHQQKIYWQLTVNTGSQRTTKLKCRLHHTSFCQVQQNKMKCSHAKHFPTSLDTDTCACCTSITQCIPIITSSYRPTQATFTQASEVLLSHINKATLFVRPYFCDPANEV